MLPPLLFFFFFFFNDTATTEIYTLSLHDALPIWYLILFAPHAFVHERQYRSRGLPSPSVFLRISTHFTATRSEEHTSELQSQSNLVCRLLLEKKKKTPRSDFLPPRTTERQQKSRS